MAELRSFLYISVTKVSESKEMASSIARICREPLSTISNASARTSRTCSITFLRCCTIRRTGRRTRGRSGWSGLASRSRAGRTAMRWERRASWLSLLREAGSLPRCWTRMRRRRGLRRARCVLRSGSSLCRPPRTGATWTVATSRSRRAGATSGPARR